jgi:hypothetical protein
LLVEAEDSRCLLKKLDARYWWNQWHYECEEDLRNLASILELEMGGSIAGFGSLK